MKRKEIIQHALAAGIRQDEEGLYVGDDLEDKTHLLVRFALRIRNATLEEAATVAKGYAPGCAFAIRALISPEE